MCVCLVSLTFIIIILVLYDLLVSKIIGVSVVSCVSVHNLFIVMSLKFLGMPLFFAFSILSM